MGQLTAGIAIPGVTEKNGRYYKVVRNEWIALSRIDEGLPALYRALAQIGSGRPGTLGELMRMYEANGMGELKPATQKDYRNILRRLEHTFGALPVNTLKANQIAHYLETRKKAGRGATRANREFAVLSSVHNYGMRQLFVDSNPCLGVRRNKERPSGRYVTHEEFLDGFNRSPEHFQDLLAFAYLTGIRQTDIFAMDRKTHMTAEGFKFVESKTGKAHSQSWSRAVAYFVNRAVSRWPDRDLIFLNKWGNPWTVWAVDSQLDRLGVSWCFKNLRAKGQTDAEHSVLGHDAQMERLYRKVIYTRPVR